jgi:polyisoprenoid-binding protein YceI
VTKPLTAQVKVTAKQDLIEIEADFDILLSDFKIEIPEYAGITVAEKVKVHTAFLTKIAKP